MKPRKVIHRQKKKKNYRDSNRILSIPEKNLKKTNTKIRACPYAETLGSH